MTQYFSVFGGTAITPSNPSYEALTISANTTLVWPTESTTGTPYVASQIDLTATVGGLSLAMPSALLGSLGQATIITNVGSNGATLTDNVGNAIVTLNSSVSWVISLTSNTTQAGTYRAVQLGATTSNAQAASLADGVTIQASGTTLQTFERTSFKTANYTLVAGDRGALTILQSGSASATFQLDTIANLTVGWWCEVSNETAANTLTITTTSNQTINGAASLSVTAGTSAKIICASGGFNALQGGGSGGSSAVANWLYKTANYTANNGESILADTSGGAFALSLPSSPSTGNWVKVGDGGGAFATNNLTINPNGATIMGTSGNQTVSTNNFSFILVYNGATWKFVT